MRYVWIAVAAIVGCLLASCEKRKVEKEVFVANMLSINNEAAVTYETGHLDELLEGKEILTLKWTDISQMDGADVMALKKAKETLLHADMAKIRFIDDGTTYVGYSSDEEVVKPTELPQEILYGFSSLLDVILPEKVTGIGSCALSQCKALLSCVLPTKLEYMDRYCFNNCISLKGITLPSSFKEMKRDSNFQLCSSLESIKFPDTTTDPGDNTFIDCTSLKSIHFGSGCKTIKDNIAIRCHSLEKVTVTSGSKYIKQDGEALVSVDGTRLLIQPYLCTSGDYKVKGCKYVSIYIVSEPYSTIEFEEGCSTVCASIRGCNYLNKVIFPSTIKTISQAPFVEDNPSVQVLEVRSTEPPYMEDQEFVSKLGARQIKVPASAVSAYKTAAKWSIYSSIISAI